LNTPQTGDDGVEEVQEDQGDVRIVVQLPIPGPVPPTGILVKPLEQRHQQLEVLEAVEVLFLDLGF
jgi:hypothetical protein